jgi:N-formylglutamate amidohydrolase
VSFRIYDHWDAPFHIKEPNTASPLVLSVPHSGRAYTQAFKEQTRLALDDLRRSEDAYIDELFAPLVEHNATMLCAHFPRVFVDVNREPYELDPRLFRENLPNFANKDSARVHGGLGTLPRIVGEGHEIYAERLPLDEAIARISQCYKPYHAMLQMLLATTWQRHGRVLLLDCHSMPASSVHGIDVVLGDRFGTSCNGTLILALDDALTAQGFRVARNRPYAGGFITEFYGAPSAGRDVVQIEINRGLYLDEKIFQPLPRFKDVQTRLIEALRGIAA